jgi:glycosyltransferase involved in cell wall biosynthesis
MAGALDTEGPLVSVVIPTYQRAGLIRDALESVAAQSWRPIEAVVIDDGSSDGTESVVTGWAENADIPVRYVWQENAGGNAARNAGIAHAGGEVIAFLDSDDLWHPDKTERQMRLLGGPDEFGAVYCALRETDAATGRILNEPAMTCPQGDLLDRLLVRDETAPTSAWLVRRPLLQDVGGFDEDLRARQDWDLWIRLAAITRIGAVAEPLLSLRHHDGPRTASDPTRELMAYAAIRAKNRALLRSRPLGVRLAARAAFHRRSGRVRLHYMGERGRALAHYVAAVCLWPVEADSWAALVGWFLPGAFRARLRAGWNRVFGNTRFAIRSH